MNTQARDMQDDIDDTDLDASTDSNDEEELDDDDFEVEVVDDVAPEDKPRRAEEEKPDIPDDADLEGYSESVQKRLKKLTFEAREAERQRQEAIRQREEAIAYAQRVYQQNQQLQEYSSKGQEYAVEQAKARATSEVQVAESAYKQAYEAGDSQALLEAQKALSKAQNDLYRLEQWRPQARPQAQQPAPQVQPKPSQPSTPELNSKQQAWLERNRSWYGSNSEMTGYALGVHERLVKSGVDPDSDTYYNEIDAAVRRRFADEFPDEQEPVKPAPRKAQNVVAPAARTQKSPRRITLTASQAAIAKRLGLTPKQYAEQLVKEQNNG